MFIVEITYTAPLEEIDKYLMAHRQFLDEQYQQGLFLASGPQKPRTGGIIIALTQDQEKLTQVLARDPFQLAQIASYRLIEFSPIKHHETLRPLIAQSEGKLC